MIRSLNRDLVKEFYLLIRSYQMMVEPMKPEHYSEVANLFRSMGGLLITGEVQSYRFYKTSTTAQIVDIREALQRIFIATMTGSKSGVNVAEIYDDRDFVLPVEATSMSEVDSCMVLHTWAALLNANKDESVFVVIARQPDQDYTIPIANFNFPACFPYDLSPDARNDVIPAQLRHLNIGIVEMPVREMLRYPLWMYEREMR